MTLMREQSGTGGTNAGVVTPVSADADAHWIPVSGRVPEPLRDVLVAYTGIGGEPAVDIAYRKPDGCWVVSGSDPEIEVTPGWWMALPQPPWVAGTNPVVFLEQRGKK